MKKGWLLLLLISLGLNLGLGSRVLNDLRFGSETGSNDEYPPHTVTRDSTWWKDRLEIRLDRMSRTLELRPEQARALGRTQRDAGRRMREYRRTANRAREDLYELVTAVPSNPDSIQAAIRHLSSCQTVVDSFVTVTMLQEMEILDPDQRGRYLKMLPLGKHRRHGRGEHGKRQHGRQPCIDK